MQLDKTTFKFLKYLVASGKIDKEYYFVYCDKNNIDKITSIRMYSYLLSNQYIQTQGKNIFPSFLAEMIVNYVKENKLNSFFINHILPYIQQLFIFLLGLSTPYILKGIKQIIQFLNI